MSDSYPGRIGLGLALLATTLVVAAAGTVVVGLHLLLPEPGTELSIPAQSPADPADPAASAVIDCPTEAVPEQPTASSMIDCPDTFDGQQVHYEGEVVEVVVRRAGYAVAVLNDDAYGRRGPIPQTRTALGGNSGLTVLMPLRMLEEVRTHGSYRARGDVVAVDGVYQAASRVLGGEPAIVATSATVVLEGAPIQHGVPGRLLVVAAATSVLAAALTGLAWRDRRR